jgi:AcrR family transcriptional regulator
MQRISRGLPVSASDIAAASGVNRPLINYHFGSADMLHSAAVARLVCSVQMDRITSLHAAVEVAPSLGEFTRSVGTIRSEWDVEQHDRIQFEMLRLALRARSDLYLSSLVAGVLAMVVSSAESLIASLQKRGWIDPTLPLTPSALFWMGQLFVVALDSVDTGMQHRSAGRAAIAATLITALSSWDADPLHTSTAAGSSCEITNGAVSRRCVILSATADQLRAVGAIRLRISDVAARSGYSVGTIYNEFPSREALIAAAGSSRLNHVTSSIAAGVSVQLDPGAAHPHTSDAGESGDRAISLIIAEAYEHRWDWLESLLHGIPAGETISTLFPSEYHDHMTEMARSVPGISGSELEFVLECAIVGMTRGEYLSQPVAYAEWEALLITVIATLRTDAG